MNILRLDDIFQLRHLRRHAPQLLATHQLITHDLTVAWELERQGIRFLDEFAFLSPAEIHANWDAANRLATSWHEGLWRSGTREHELARCAGQELVYPFEIGLNARTIYERVFQQYSVESVTLCTMPPQAITRTGPPPARRAGATISQAVVRWVADQRRIPVQWVQCPPAPGPEGSAALPDLAAPEAARPVPPSNAGRVAVLLEMGLRGHERDRLDHHVRSDLGLHPVWIPPWEFTTGGVLLSPTLPRAQLDEWRNTLRRAQRDYSGPHPELFANPDLKFQFEAIFRQMDEADRTGGVFARILDQMRPVFVALGHDAFTRERWLVHLARQRKIPSVALFHGGLGHHVTWRGAVGDADHLLVWGRDDERALRMHGVEADRIHVVGSLQYERKYLGEPPPPQSAAGETTRLARAKLNLPADRPVVTFLTASTSAGLAQIVADPDVHRQTWRQLLALAGRRSDLTFIVKPHPSYDHHELYRCMLASEPSNVLLADGKNLTDVLAATDVAVLVNYCTTAGMESIFMNIPTVFVRAGVLPLAEWADSFGGRPELLVESGDALETRIDSLLPIGAERAAVVTSGHDMLRAVLGEATQRVWPRMSQVFVELSARHGAGADSQSTTVARATQPNIPPLELPADLDERSALAYALGSRQWSPAELLGALNEIVRAQRDRDTARQFVVVGLLRAMSLAVVERQWQSCRKYALLLLLRYPREVYSSGMFRRLLLRGLLGSSRVAWMIAAAVRNLLWLPRTVFSYSKAL